jgi:hypothetical protein
VVNFPLKIDQHIFLRLSQFFALPITRDTIAKALTIVLDAILGVSERVGFVKSALLERGATSYHFLT